MTEAEYLKQHALVLGQIMGNLQSLEFLIRIFLYRRRKAPHHPFRRRKILSTVKAGDSVPENAVTSYHTLGQLIDRYNSIVVKDGPGNTLDRSVVILRDALAHGRIWADSPGPPMRLLKFSKPQHGATTVLVAESLTLEWMAAKRQLVHINLMKVAARVRKGRRK